jgi:hypothetical protein
MEPGWRRPSYLILTCWLINTKATHHWSRNKLPLMFKKRLTLWGRLVRAAFPHVPLYIQKCAEIQSSGRRLVDWRNLFAHGMVTVTVKGRTAIVAVR